MTENTKKVLINTGLALSVFIIAFFVMAPLEVIRRAKREFLEGERHLSFYKNAEAKKQYYDEQLSKKKISEPQYRMLMEDNSLKNAYVQYQTVTDLFTPPESKWVKKSRERLKEIEPEYNAWVQQLQKEIEAAGYKKKPIK